MTTNDILELVRAGYTKSEIESMNSTEPKAQEPKAQEPKAQEPKAQEPKAQEPKAQEPKAQEPKTEEGKPDKGYSELLKAVNSLSETVKAMQADNAKKASNEQPKTETAESAIRSFFEDTPKN